MTHFAKSPNSLRATLSIAQLLVNIYSKMEQYRGGNYVIAVYKDNDVALTHISRLVGAEDIVLTFSMQS